MKPLLISLVIVLLTTGCAKSKNNFDIPPGYNKPAYQAPAPPDWVYNRGIRR